jgi:hypothetical protein
MAVERSSFTVRIPPEAAAAACGVPTGDMINAHQIEVSTSANSGLYAFALSASDKKHPVTGKPITEGIELGNLSVVSHNGDSYITSHANIPNQPSTTLHPVLNQIAVGDHASAAAIVASKSGSLWRNTNPSHIGVGATRGTTTGPKGETVHGKWVVQMMGKPGPGKEPVQDTIWTHCKRLAGTGKELPEGVTSHTDGADGQTKFIMTDDAFTNLAEKHSVGLKPITPIGTHGISVTATCIKPPTNKADTHIHVGVKLTRVAMFNEDGSHNIARGQTRILSAHVGHETEAKESSKSGRVDQSADEQSAMYGLPLGSKVNTVKWNGLSTESRLDVSTKSTPTAPEPADSTDDEDSD